MINFADCDSATAETLCKINHLHDGTNLEPFQKAIKLSEIVEVDWDNVDLSKLTIDELKALGKRNVVQTPKDKLFEGHLKALKKTGPEDEVKPAPPVKGAV